jgi:hypothetical protein
MKNRTTQSKRKTNDLQLNSFKRVQKATMKNAMKIFGTILIVTSVFAFSGGKFKKSNSIKNESDILPQDTSLFGKIEPDAIFTIENGSELISPLDVDQLHKFEIVKNREVHEVKFIVMGSGGATDVGPYNEVYLVFDNGIEMPWRFAIYTLGKFYSVSNVTQINDHVFRIEGIQFVNFAKNIDCQAGGVEVVVDISALLHKEKELNTSNQHLYIEGSIESEIQISVFNPNCKH